MKAILITRCGCSRMVDIPGPYPVYNVPLISYYIDGYFRQQDHEDLDSWNSMERRVFVLERHIGFPTQEGAIQIYREKGTETIKKEGQ
jgi:hypothetical protein